MSRYIDADILAEMVEEEFDDLVVYDVPPDEAVNDICDIINSCPTADVKPVVHGHWGDEISVREYDDVNGGYFITRVVPCSNCGYEIAARNKTKFCPECGAKMESEETNNVKVQR